MSSRPSKTATKLKKSVASKNTSPSESGVPTWLQEESSNSEMSNSADPWLSGSAVVAEVAPTLSDDAGSSMTSAPLTGSGVGHSKGKGQKRPRMSSANEQPSESADAKVSVEGDLSDANSDKSSMTEATHQTGAVPPLATRTAGTVPLSSSDSGEDVIIDDCTFSDDGDCVILDNATPAAQPSSNTQSSPPPPSSTVPGSSCPPDPPESGEPVPFGLGEVIPVDDNTVLVTTAPQFCLLLWGAYQVRVLRGAVRLHGATLTPSRTDFLPVFALRVKALPPLRPVEGVSDDASEGAADGPPPEKLPTLPKKAAAALQRVTGCALLLRRLPSRLLTLLAAEFGDTFTPRAGNGDDVVLSHTGCRLLRDAAEMRLLQVKPHVTSAKWEERLQQLMAASAKGERLRVVFAGGKGVGKSTWMYYVLNMLLSTCGHVYVLDLDPGQAEFTPCACLSLVKVDTPLVGPSLTHLTKAVRSVLIGEVSVANDPSGYMEAVQQLAGTYQELARTDPAPLLVNTMGWAKGLGEDLLLEVLGLMQPTDLLEVSHAAKEHVNFERPLTTALVNAAGRSWLMQKYLPRGAPGRPPVSYRHSRLTSPGHTGDSQQTSSTLAPWMYRQLNTTAFVASLERDDRTLCQLTPICVPWSCLAVHVTTQQVLPQHMMHAINGTVVALCWSDASSWIPPDDRSLFSLLPQPHSRPPCLGFGLVRGVDAPRRLLYLLTDLTPGELQSVNTVVRGPHHLLDVFPADSGLRSWTPALTNDTPLTPLHRPNNRHKRARIGAMKARPARC